MLISMTDMLMLLLMLMLIYVTDSPANLSPPPTRLLLLLLCWSMLTEPSRSSFSCNLDFLQEMETNPFLQKK